MITRYIMLEFFGKSIYGFDATYFKNYTELNQASLPWYTRLPFIKVKYYIKTSEGWTRLA